jgi:hypothetical protein
MKTFMLNDSSYSCYGWYILKNGWEVFFLEDPADTDGIYFSYVMGFESEFGSVCLQEYKGHELMKLVGARFDSAVQRGELAAPEGASWVEEDASVLVSGSIEEVASCP